MQKSIQGFAHVGNNWEMTYKSCTQKKQVKFVWTTAAWDEVVINL